MPNFELGELILVSKPYAYVLSNTCRGLRCDYCFAKHNDLKRCSQCSFLYFCNRNCQEKAWKTHKSECKFIMKSRPKEPTALMRLISLIILKIKKYGQDEPFEEVHGRKVSFQTLMSHSEEIKQSVKPCQQMMALIGTMKDYIGQANIPSPSEFIEIFGKAVEFILGMYRASVFDHSCSPNAEVVFVGVNLHVRAAKHIPHRDISKVYISYIEQLQLTKERQEALLEQYFFLCQCENCLSSDYNDLMSKLLVSEKDAEHHLLNFKAGIEHVKQMKKDNASATSIYSACIQELAAQDNVLADTHIFRAKILEFAFDACIQSNQWADAVTIGKQLLKPYRLFYGPYHPTLGIHLFKVGKIQVLLNLPTSSETLQQAENVLKVTHGESHPLYQDLLKLMYESQTMQYSSTPSIME